MVSQAEDQEGTQGRTNLEGVRTSLERDGQPAGQQGSWFGQAGAGLQWWANATLWNVGGQLALSNWWCGHAGRGATLWATGGPYWGPAEGIRRPAGAGGFGALISLSRGPQAKAAKLWGRKDLGSGRAPPDVLTPATDHGPAHPKPDGVEEPTPLAKSSSALY